MSRGQIAFHLNFSEEHMKSIQPNGAIVNVTTQAQSACYAFLYWSSVNP